MLISLNARNDFQVARGEQDPRGWLVFAENGQIVGTVDDLLAETREMRVRYLDVSLSDPAGHELGDRHVLVPIADATFGSPEHRVVIEGLFARDLDTIAPAGDIGDLERYDEQFDRQLGRQSASGQAH